MSIKNRYPAALVPDGPANSHFAITPHDTNDLPELTRGIYVGTAGTVVIVDRYGTELAWENAQAGTVLPIRAQKVKLTDTTATDLIGLV